MANTETTGLLSSQKPHYVFESNLAWQRRKRVKQFQCCLCAIFLCALVLALVATVSFTINSNTNGNNTDVNTTIIDLLFLNVPLNETNYHNFEANHEKCQFALNKGIFALLQRDKLENGTATLEHDSPSYRHQMVTATSNYSRFLSRSGYAENHASKTYFANKYKNDHTVKCSLNTTANIQAIYLITCNTSKPQCNPFHLYRSFNGSCNNLKNPQYGVAYTPFKRMLPPSYSDGISSPRKSVSGGDLPSARTVSVVVHRPYYRDDPKFTVMLAVWGQFLDHDLTATALNQAQDGKAISCCNNDGTVRENAHPECFPVFLDKADPYFKNYNITCMEFVRSAPAPTCRLGPREQLNQASSFLDGSVVYGTDEAVANSLRSFKNGLLKMFVTPDNRTLLPISDDKNDGCNRAEEYMKGRYCFASGDSRANENLHLTSMHLLWARQHNKLANELHNLNPSWDDERIFQEARRILVAQMQHITFNEFLPILLGEKLMDVHKLRPLKNGYHNKYDENIDPAMANAFVASAFRFAHTLIPTLMKMLTNDSTNPEYVQLHRMLFDPFQLYDEGGMDSAIRGAMNTKIQASDPFFSPELKEHLFERTEVDDEAGNLGRSSSLIGSRNSGRKLCGLDLVSLNIQRGRDHGLTGYTSWRQRCGLHRPQSFQDLAGDMDDDSRHYIQTIYSHVDDIDLYTGALSEIPRKDSILGPTITCLILDQFVRLKRGDRFWYENDLKPHRFSQKQLREIRKTKLSNIICDNSDNVEYAQPHVMRRIFKGNENTLCKNLEKPNLEIWKENTSDMKRTSIPDDRTTVKIKN